MLKDYVLGTEVAKKGNFHIANISMLLKDFGMVEGVDYLKFGGITLLNKNSLKCPKYIYKLMWDKSMTDLTDLIPLTLLKDTVENTVKMIENDFKPVKVEGKQFVEITNDTLKQVFMSDTIIKTVVANDEIEALEEEDFIKGHVKLSKSKSLCWY